MSGHRVEKVMVKGERVVTGRLCVPLTNGLLLVKC